jgi:hypothetical protein
MKCSETPHQIIKDCWEAINHRWKQLYDLQTKAGQTALQHLFFANAGGAGTTLAFIDAIGAGKIGLGVKIALAIYVFGLILIGILDAKAVHHIGNLFEQWQSLVKDYLDNKISYEEMMAADKKKAVEDIWDSVVPYASFGCFILGSSMGFYALLKAP